MSERLEAEFDAQGHVDEGTIHTWLDGAFDEDVALQVARHVDGCAHCQASVAEARGFIAGASRITRALDEVPSNIVPASDIERAASRIVAAAASTASSRATSRSWYQSNGVRFAATLAMMIGGSVVVWNRVDHAVPVASMASPSARAADAAPHTASDTVVATAPAQTSASTSTPLRDAEQSLAKAKSRNAPKAEARAEVESGVVGAGTSAAATAAANVVAAASPPAAAPPQAAQDRVMSVAAAAAPSQAAGASAAASAADRTVADRSDRKKEVQAGADVRAMTEKSTGLSINGITSPMREGRAFAAARPAPLRQSCWTLALDNGAQPSRFGVTVNDTDFVRATSVAAQLIGWPTAAQSTTLQLARDDRNALRGTVRDGDLALAIDLVYGGDTWTGIVKQSRLGDAVTHRATLAMQNTGVCK